MDIQFFTTDNKSGYKTKNGWLGKNHPSEYEKVTTYKHTPIDASYKEQIWFYYSKLKERPKCCGCNEELKFQGRFDRPYLDFCSLTCANTNGDLVERVKKTNQEKYGVDFFTQHDTFMEKQKQTKLERYGDENFNNMVKTTKTKLERYGDVNYNNSEKNKISRRESFIELVKEKTNDKFVSYKLDSEDITLNCQFCDEDYEIYNTLFNYRTQYGVKLCTKCNEIGVKQQSSFELDLIDWLSEYVDVETQNRTILDGKEIDVLIPSKNFGIEFDGLHWHSELYTDKNYHLEKTKLAESKGISLIHVFEDEWIEKTEIVKSIIKKRLDISDEVLYGRKCNIKEPTKQEYKKFITENHIQGFVGSSIVYGLYYNDELVSVMSFGKNRKNMGSTSKEGQFELLRFCNKLNASVVGGASRLFKHFIKTHNPIKITSYSDKRYFDGSMYGSLGFTKSKDTTPNYFYVIGHRRENRFKYRKDVLIKEGYDQSKTEKEIMLSRRIYRIYDCGNIRWEWDIYNKDEKSN